MPRLGGKLGVGSIGAGKERLAIAEYTFAAQGGAVGNITMRGDTIPNGAIVLDTLVIVDIVPTSGGAATLGVTGQTAGDVVAPVVISGAPWSTVGAKRGALTRTSAPIVTTAERALVAVVGVAALTAGRFRVVVTYIETSA